MISFTVPQVYIKGRAKHGGGRTYTPAKTVKYEKMIKAICMDVMRRRGLKMFTEPVVMTVDIRLVPPKSMSKKKRAALFSGEIGITGSYDADNVAKAVSDALNKTAFQDDRLIVDLHVRKIASTYEAVDVTIEDYREHRAKQDQGHQDRTAHRRPPEDQGPDAGLGAAAGEGLEAEELGAEEAGGVCGYRASGVHAG